jgi:hypothetical protein
MFRSLHRPLQFHLAGENINIHVYVHYLCCTLSSTYLRLLKSGRKVARPTKSAKNRQAMTSHPVDDYQKYCTVSMVELTPRFTLPLYKQPLEQYKSRRKT